MQQCCDWLNGPLPGTVLLCPGGKLTQKKRRIKRRFSHLLMSGD
uniref:Uncharacterized protein n=1 Tax=Erwinia amylovora ATCC BAA-2158 TaxID=889211 RepID=E5B6U7_ERWAM|nr:hypothetical protein predicted by Glimmer/Critica [Erwinia amylovora ATCC BAA-2158]